MKSSLGRHIVRAVITPLYGRINEFTTIDDAIRFLENHSIDDSSSGFRRYEIRVDYSNGDKFEAQYEAKAKAREFLDFVAKQ